MNANTWRRWFGPTAIVFVSAGAACVGQIGDPLGGPGAQPLSCDGTTISPGTAPIRRMTNFEYNNTVRDLLGDTTQPANSFPPDEVSNGFNNQAETLVVTDLLVQSYMTAAEGLAATAATNLTTFVGCDPSSIGAATCGAQFIQSFGKKAFRRPLDAGGTALLTGVFTSALSTWDFPTAIQLVVQTALESPRFLYRFESGMPDPSAPGVSKLDAYEVASRLSYLLWGSMPDATLMAAADADALGTPALVAAQAKRMLADPKARDVIQNFHDQWLQLDQLASANKDTTLFPKYTPALETTWKAETLAFVTDVIIDQHGDLGTLLSAPYTMMNADVAAFYGISGGPTGSTFVHVDLDPTQRAGLVTQPSILALTAHSNETSPTLRGKFVREQLLCEPVRPPPPGIVIAPPAPMAGATTRQQYSEHATNPYCATCHDLMDPIGFGLENYDPLGLWRTTDQGQPIDDSGDITGSKDADGTFAGGVTLAQRLSTSNEVRACVVSQWFTYAQGRPVTNADACSTGDLQAAFAASNYDIQALLVALTQTDAFLYRNTVVPGM
jgi:hypothetical protein